MDSIGHNFMLKRYEALHKFYYRFFYVMAKTYSNIGNINIDNEHEH
jgi:hypothetical protein